MSIEELSILSSLELSIQEFINNFNKLAFKHNRENNNIIFLLSRRFSIINLFKKISYTRVNSKLKSFILIFKL